MHNIITTDNVQRSITKVTILTILFIIATLKNVVVGNVCEPN